MEPLAAELAAELAALRRRRGDACRSSLDRARRAARRARELDAGYWARNLRQPVRFADAVSQLIERWRRRSSSSSARIRCCCRRSSRPAQARGARTVGRRIACGRRDEPANRAVARPPSARCGRPALRDRLAHGSMRRRRVGSSCRRIRGSASGTGAEAADAAAQPAARGAAFGSAPDDEALRLAARADMAWRAGGRGARDGGPASLRSWPATTPTAAAALADAVRALGRRPRMRARSTRAGGGADGACAAAARRGGCWCPTRRSAPHLPAARRCRRCWPRGARRPGCGSSRAARRRSRRTSARGRCTPPRSGAAARVIADEHPELWGGLVDLDPARPLGRQRSALHARPAGRPTARTRSRWRGGQRHRAAPGGAAEHGAARRSLRWRADGAYLITGGLGGVGLHVARAMVAAGARRLVLLGRTRAAAARRTGATRRRDAPPAGASPRCASSKPPAPPCTWRRSTWPTSAQLARLPRRLRRRGVAADPRRRPCRRHARQRTRRATWTAATFDAVRAAQAARRVHCSIGCCPTSTCSCCSRRSVPSWRSPARPTTPRPTPASTRSARDRRARGQPALSASAGACGATPAW